MRLGYQDLSFSLLQPPMTNSGLRRPTDAVVRSQYYKYFHPKECYVSNGILNRALSQMAGKSIPGMGMDDDGNNTQ